MHSSEAINELAAALAIAQGQVKGAVKDAVNPHFRSKYSDLSSIWDACREALTKNGLSVVQSPGSDKDRVFVTTRLIHKSGQWLEGTVGAPLAQPSAQATGSVITYLRRYSLAAMVGVVSEDDDAETGSHAPAAPARPAGPPPAMREALDLEPEKPAKRSAPSDGAVMPFGKTKGKPLADLPDREIESALAWARSKDKFQEFQRDAEAELARRKKADETASAAGPGLDEYPPGLDEPEDELPF